jgi:serine/threonine protein phosphatase PrpC
MAAQDKSENMSKNNIFQNAVQGAKQYQEDSYFSFESPNKLITVGGIFDGHGGMNGMIASNAARDHSLQYFDLAKTKCEEWGVENWRANLLQLFEEIHEKIREVLREQSLDRIVDEKGVVRSGMGNPVHGGCTGSIIVQKLNADGSSTFISANVGDSTALLCFTDETPEEPKYHMLTVKHDTNHEEFLRIRDLPSEQYPTKLMFVYDVIKIQRKYECPLIFNEAGEKDEKYKKDPWNNGLRPVNVRMEVGAYAVTPKDIYMDSTCIAVTRALGDFYAHPFGLTHKPSITVYELPAKRSCIVTVASDGIWDCWAYNDFVDYVKTCPNMHSVMNETIGRAIHNFGAKYYDDAALVAWTVRN